MKHMKSILALALVLVLTLSLGTAVWADDAAATTTGTITVETPVVGQTYTIYEILKLESYNKDASAYAYKAASDKWSAFITSSTIKGVYVNVDEQGYVTWVDKADAAAFAKLALAYAKDNGIANQGSTTAAENTAVTFTGLELGYYLLDSTLGTLCSLDTTNPTVTVKEKNSVPSNEKTVKEGTTYGKVNDANVGDTVSFQSTVTLNKGAENVVFYDTMTEGLTLTQKSIKVGNLTTDDYTIGYTDATFTVTFAQKYLDTISAETTIDITYDAVLNSNAVVADKGNINESYVSYGDKDNTKTTPKTTTTTYTWQFDVFKYTKNGETETALAGAEFVVYKTSGENNAKSYVVADSNNKVTGWTDDSTKATVFKTPDSGKFAVTGIDSGSYYLEETKAPAGYNKLAAAIAFSIEKDANSTSVTVKQGTGTGTIKVENQTGAILPSTGGMGTTIFYIVGALLVAAAVVVLVTRKRMGKAEN